MLARAKAVWAALIEKRQSPQSYVRRFDGAAGGRRGSGIGTFGPINSEVSAAGPMLRSRARYLVQNNPWISHAVANWVGALVGAGITPTSKNPEAMQWFSGWAEMADFDGLTDFYGFQEAVARSLVIDGEALIHIVETDAGTRLRLLPVELLDWAYTRPLESGGYAVNGVEFDSSGRRVAYWIFPAIPTSQFQTYFAPVRIPADDILHVFKPLAPGQVRGVSWLAPVILPAAEFDQLCDALLVGAKVAAMHSAFLVDQNGTAQSPYEGVQTGSVLEGGIEPGAIKYLPAGYDIKFNSPGQAQELQAFIKTNLLALAAGLGLPDHLVSGDLSGANYSSLRAGLLPFRQRVEQIQWGVLAPQFLRPVWRRAITSAVLSGDLDAPDFESNPRSWLASEWLPPKPLQVDPLKDNEATLAELAAGLTSRTKAAAERGWNVDELDNEIAADAARAKALGLTFNYGGAANAGQSTQSAN
ncbi:MAG: phage portal protein [Asticcacaulis sp.]|uniref:phage portal protein n=1 Tax=Asticcacaulis sp. TaxID=1872648 RepID=UPI003F7C16D3